MKHELDSSLFVEYLKSRYSTIHLIISPPRCSSTALARTFWGHPDIRYYAHEPFETTYYEQASLISALKMIDEPIDLEVQYSRKQQSHTNGLIIKEMPYQVGSNFGLLTSLTKFPLTFLVRDPRLSIYSRIQKKIEAGKSPSFPLVETGWTLLEEQIEFCRTNRISFIIVKSDDFRNDPSGFLPQFMEKVGLTYSPDLLDWDSASSIDLDNLAGAHSHLYLKVLASTGVLPATEPVPLLEDFPDNDGIREHVKEAINIYERILQMEELLKVNGA